MSDLISANSQTGDRFEQVIKLASQPRATHVCVKKYW